MCPIKKKELLHVITSYSIHYTKLYESSKAIINEDVYTIQTRLFGDIIFNKVDSETIEKRCIENNLLEIKDKFFLIVIIQLDNYNVIIEDCSFDEIAELQKKFSEEINDAINNVEEVFLIEGNRNNFV